MQKLNTLKILDMNFQYGITTTKLQIRIGGLNNNPNEAWYSKSVKH